MSSPKILNIDLKRKLGKLSKRKLLELIGSLELDILAEVAAIKLELEALRKERENKQ